jgi:PIN like domain
MNEDWKSLFYQPKKIDELIHSAVVVVDTNVLLSAYQWRNVTVKEVLKVLKELNGEERLKIPLQAVEEFAKNRPEILKERLNEIEMVINGLKTEKALNQRVPMLEGEEVYIKANSVIEQYNQNINELRSVLKDVRDKVKDLFVDDPYLTELYSIVKDSLYIPENYEPEQLKQKAKERFAKKIPPGFKDSSKEDNSEGDYFIWDSILQLGTDVIFISNDKKSDWVYKDKKDQPISARRELVEEFYKETGGKNFTHLSPNDFISLYNPSVSVDVQEDLIKSINDKNTKNKTKSSDFVISKINKILIKYDPLGVMFDNVAQEDQYIADARRIFELYNRNQDFSERRRTTEIVDILEDGNFKLKMSVAEIIDMVDEIDGAVLSNMNIDGDDLWSILRISDQFRA